MAPLPRLPGRTRVAAAASLLAAAGVLLAADASARPWRNYGGDSRHTAVTGRRAEVPTRIRWQAPVDLQPQYSGGDLFIHYGTPLVTARNTVVFPVKTGAADGFRVDALRADTGGTVWSMDTDYTLPSHDWVPSCGLCLAAPDRVCIPASGGTVLLRTRPDRADGTTTRVAFYGTEAYAAGAAPFDGSVRISTPLTSDARGNLYFGFTADPGAPLGLQSGIARVSRSGRGRWVSAAAAAGDVAIRKVVTNCAPALSRDGRLLYVAVNDADGPGFGAGYLLALDSRTLALRHEVRLEDPANPGSDAYLPDDGTSSPTVGPDGDVFFGILSFSNHFRGFMLHFDGRLGNEGTPGGFGWDDTASIVPRAAVPGYAGGSRYLILTKYNDYVEAGGTGVNRLAVLDPGDTMTDPISGATVMNEVLTIAGPTPDVGNVDAQHPDAVREWCINTAAVDPAGRCALVNNEDGVLYRWDFTTNTLTASLVLTAGVGEAYTPTVVGPDGAVYAVNDATLFCTDGGAPP